MELEINMNIELKNVKFAAFASQETNCFTASVYIDGKKEGTVSNEGHGGSNFYHPYTLGKKLDDYAKTLAPILSKYFPEGLEQCADIVIGDAFESYMRRRDLERLLKGQVVTLQDGKLYGQKLVKVKDATSLLRNREADIRKVLKIAPTTPILNLMPFDEAMRIYLTATGAD